MYLSKEVQGCGTLDVRILVASIMAVMVMLSASLWAQGPASWNREVVEIAVTDNSSGGHHVSAVIKGEAADLTAIVDLSMDVVFSVNSVPVDTQTITLTMQPAGGGTGPCDFPCELGEVCHCHGLPPDCECGVWIGLPTTETTLVSGDLITVAVSPRSTAASETNTSDDLLRATYDGEEIFWNRSVESIKVTPPPPDCSDLHTISAQFRLDGAGIQSMLNLSADAVFYVNSVEVDRQRLVLSMEPSGGPGGGPCGDFPCQLGEVCYCHGLPPDCECGFWIGTGETEQDLIIGDILKVQLKPVPGALPELPGFPDDDSEEGPLENTCDYLIASGDGLAGDITGPDGVPDCQVDLLDLSALANDWLQCNNPVPGECFN